MSMALVLTLAYAAAGVMTALLWKSGVETPPEGAPANGYKLPWFKFLAVVALWPILWLMIIYEQLGAPHGR